MSSHQKGSKRPKSQKNVGEGHTPAKTPAVITVTALFKKQLEKAGQTTAYTTNVTASGTETDSDDGVMFVKEEWSSPYFGQKTSERHSDTATALSADKSSFAAREVLAYGVQKRLGRKLSLRRTEKRGQSSDSQSSAGSHSGSAAACGSRSGERNCNETAKAITAVSAQEAGDSVETNVTDSKTMTVCEQTSDLSADCGALSKRQKVDYGDNGSLGISTSVCACPGMYSRICLPSNSNTGSSDQVVSQASDGLKEEKSATLRKESMDKSRINLPGGKSSHQREGGRLPVETTVHEFLKPKPEHPKQHQFKHEQVKPKGKLSLKVKKSTKTSKDPADVNSNRIRNSRPDEPDEHAPIDSQQSEPAVSIAGDIQNEAVSHTGSSQDGDSTSEIANSSKGDSVDTNKESQHLVPYYLENFREILKTVMEDNFYEQLFNEPDLKHVAAFNSLTEESQKLYIRLFSRKLAWLPVSKINYPEISADLTPFFRELVSSALLHSDENLTDLVSVLGSLSAPDLRTLAKSYHLNPSGQQKGQIVQSLVARSQQNTVASMFGQKTGSVAHSMLNRAKKLLGHIYRLEEEPRRVFIRVMMLFSLANTSIDEESGNGGQAQLFQMLMVNIGRVVYPSYSINRQTMVFRDRDDLIKFEEALQLESELLGRTGAGDWAGAYSVFLQVKDQYDALLSDTTRMEWDAGLPEFLRYYTAGSVLVRLLHQGIDILQRRKDYTAAVSLIRELLSQDVYNLDLHGFWWERLALNLDVHLKQQEQALQAIQDGLADPAVRTGHRLALYLRAESICKKPKSPYRKRLQDFNHEPLLDLPKTYVEGRVLADGVGGRIHQFMTDSSQTGDETGDITLCNVEQVVMDHYKANGFPQGVHAEGSVVSTLFTLYFWEVLFMDVVDAFHSPYQTHPLDFHTDAFYHRRKTCIDARLAEIESSSEEELHRMMTETWEANFNVICAGLNSERFTSIEQLQGLISCMGGKVLAGILGRYAHQPRHTRGGFPDLTLWNTNTKQLKICEVKGPGDRLSHKQMLWLSHLLKLGVDAEVCHVKAVGAKKLKRSLPAGD